MDPRFAETVILLLDLGSQGAMGLIVNRPTTITLSSLFPEIKGLQQRSDAVFFGGPVEGRMIFLLVRSKERPPDSITVVDSVHFSRSRAVLEDIVTHPREAQLHAYAGYAGWGAGQLEREISRGDWYVFSADAGTIFDKDPDSVWPDLIRRTAAEWVRAETAIGTGM
jgi:putative transcriptional regulator